MRPPFVPFDRQQATRVYRRNLPHWRQQGATYFVTFRLHDALPESARRRLQQERDQWLTARGVLDTSNLRTASRHSSQRDQFILQRHLNRLREDIDNQGYGECHLRRTDVIDVLREQLFAEDGGILHTGDFIIMPNHVHLLITPDQLELEHCMQRIKGRSAVQCNRLLKRTGTFWQADTFDHIVRNVKQLDKYRRYIADNARQAGIKVAPTAYYRAEWL